MNQLNPTVKSVVPTVTGNSAYAAGNVVGGVQSLAGALRGVGSKAGAGKLTDIIIYDKSNQKAPLTLLIFSAPPTTANGNYNDKTNAALAPDAASLIGQVSVANSDYVTSGSDSVAVAAKTGLNVTLYNNDPTAANDQTKVYVVPLTTGTPNFGSNAALGFTYKIDQF